MRSECIWSRSVGPTEYGLNKPNMCKEIIMYGSAIKTTTFLILEPSIHGLLQLIGIQFGLAIKNDSLLRLLFHSLEGGL